MSRVIKFRAWDKEDKCYVDMIDDIYLETYCGMIYESYGGQLSPQKNLELMQYTGLKDKNGVLIYESDIVNQHGNYKAVVEFWNGSFGCKINQGQWLEFSQNCLFDKAIVIGNIHENPELLKTKEPNGN